MIYPGNERRWYSKMVFKLAILYQHQVGHGWLQIKQKNMKVIMNINDLNLIHIIMWMLFLSWLPQALPPVHLSSAKSKQAISPKLPPPPSMLLTGCAHQRAAFHAYSFAATAAKTQLVRIGQGREMQWAAFLSAHLFLLPHHLPSSFHFARSSVR